MLYAVSMTLKTWWRVRLQSAEIKKAVKTGYLLPIVAVSDIGDIHKIPVASAIENYRPSRSLLYVLSFGIDKIVYRHSVSMDELIHPWGLPYSWWNLPYSYYHETMSDVDPDRIVHLIDKIEAKQLKDFKFFLLQVFYIQKEKLNAS